MIIFNKVSKSYKEKEVRTSALNNVSFTIQQHELFGVIGESGSGKSTLLRMINTLEEPTQGEIEVNGLLLKNLTDQEKRKSRKKIGMIFQQFNLLGNLTVGENIALPLRLNGKYTPEKVKEVLSFVGLSQKIQQFPKQLSGGEKQRVGIARALITQPDILLCDEPTSALDGQNAYDIMALLKEINRSYGTTMVIVTHELNLIKQLCDRTAVLEKGQIREILQIKKIRQQQFSSYYELVQEKLK